MQTSNFETTMVDVFEVAFVGGQGAFDEVAKQFVHAIEQYNEKYGTSLILSMDEI